MEKENATKNTAILYGNDFVEEEIMAIEPETIYEDEFFKVVDSSEETVIFSVIKRGISLMISYSEWQELIRLVVQRDVNENFDSNRRILFYDLGEAGSALFFRSNNCNLKFGCKEYELLRIALTSAGSPYPWCAKEELVASN